MGPLEHLVARERDAITERVRQHHGRSIALFGSVARGEETSESDLDFLVEFDDDASLLDLIQLRNDLIDFLGVSVDVVSLGGLKPRDGHILAEAVAL
jgi:predicted nucleotidyltransferase